MVPLLFRYAAARLYEATLPFRIGDFVVTDDPFTGRTEGTVEVKHGELVGLRSADGNLVFYDYRLLRLVE